MAVKRSQGKPSPSRVTRAKAAGPVRRDPGPVNAKADVREHTTAKPGQQAPAKPTTPGRNTPVPPKGRGQSSVPMKTGRGTRDRAQEDMQIFKQADPSHRGKRKKT